MPTSPADTATSARSTAPCLDLRGISAGYSAAPIVNDVSLHVTSGQVVSIVGPNGAGKSTLLKALTGRLRPVAGTVHLNGRDVTGASGTALTRAGLGYVPQLNDVFATLTVHENLEMGGYLLPKLKLTERLERLYELVPLLAPLRARRARTLSGGERKLLALGRCLIMEPTVIVLDEPTAGLSPQMAAIVLNEYVMQLAQSGTGILLVEQRARDALAISNWCYVLAGGQVVRSSDPATLLSQADFGQLYLGTGPTGETQATEPGNGR
jgi:ABC-type branched-subunit amino acid transport system ATPase component